MTSKRSALWLAIGGITALTWGTTIGPMATRVSAQESFVSEAFYQGIAQDSQHVEPVRFDDGNPSCHLDPTFEMIDGYDSSECDGGILANGCQNNLGEPFSLFGTAGALRAGGWAQLGYNNKALPMFNNRPDEYQLHQMWLYAEKALDTSRGFDYGGRIDYIYGTDGPDVQAFGNGNNSWDNSWDNGPDNSGYGHALPQVYGELGYGDLSVKIGHFFTILGYESVAAPDNFFFSHTYTMYYTERFTYTGALFTYQPSDNVAVYGGYTLGQDSGFENNGDSFLGGTSLQLSDHFRITYAVNGGRLNESHQNTGLSERGYIHSIVADVTVTDRIQYIAQSDVMRTKDAAGNVLRDTVGFNNYLFYTMSDSLALGARFEWYDAQGIFPNANDVDIYTFTLGVNIQPHANVLIRPEIRFDSIDGVATGILENNGDDQTTFGIDTIFLF